MKKIKKIAAGLMAAAIAAAGMGSLTASAYRGTQYRTLYWNSSNQAQAACEFNTGEYYCPRLRAGKNRSITDRTILLWADKTNGGEIWWPMQYSYSNDVFFTAYPNGSQSIKYFYADCYATCNGRVEHGRFVI